MRLNSSYILSTIYYQEKLFHKKEHIAFISSGGRPRINNPDLQLLEDAFERIFGFENGEHLSNRSVKLR